MKVATLALDLGILDMMMTHGPDKVCITAEGYNNYDMCVDVIFYLGVDSSYIYDYGDYVIKCCSLKDKDISIYKSDISIGDIRDIFHEEIVKLMDLNSPGRSNAGVCLWCTQ